MWIGTSQGLDRYDGYVFKHLVYDSNNETSIVENNVFKLIETKDKKIVIGFFGNGVGVYDRKTEKLEQYHFDPNNQSSLSNEYVAALHEDKNGLIWVGSKSGLDCIDPVKKTVSRFFPFEDFSSQTVSSITSDNEGNLWIYGPAQKLCKYNLHGERLFVLQKDSLDNKPATDFETAINGKKSVSPDLISLAEILAI